MILYYDQEKGFISYGMRKFYVKGIAAKGEIFRKHFRERVFR